LPRPGNRCQGLLWESGPSMRLGRSPWGLGQPSSKGVSPTRGLGWSTPVSVPLTDDPARLRPTRFSFQANSAPVHADTATPGLGSSKSGRGVPLTKLEKPRTTNKRNCLIEAVQTTNRRVLVLENEEKNTAPCRKYIHVQAPTATMNKNTGIQSAITNGTLVPSLRV
jgi:hypothetical protein